MMIDFTDSKHALKAVELFKTGYNCAQSVFGAFAEDMGLDLEFALKISSGFGGGMGRLRETCGAVTGGIMVLSMKYGYTDAPGDAAKANLYAIVQKFVKEFTAEFGTAKCDELIRIKDKSSTPTPRTDEFYAKRPCARFVGASAKILEKYL